MKSSQDKLLAAFPGFIATIQAKFSDFDYHIMVVDGDTEWGLITCDVACEMEGSCGGVPDYGSSGFSVAPNLTLDSCRRV
jgi:hypothetical protein